MTETSATQSAVYDVFDLLDESGKATIREGCVNRLTVTAEHLLGKAPKFEYHIKGDQKLKELISLTSKRIAELAAVQESMCQMALNSGALKDVFVNSEDGKVLYEAWRVLLDGDTKTLATYNSYAEADLGKRSGTARNLFFPLVKNAGIKVLFGGSGAAGVISGSQHGNWTFVVGEKGLYIAYDHVYNWDKKINNKTYTVAVVDAKSLGETGPGKDAVKNTDEAAIKEMAAAIAKKLFDHYAAKK